jgi:hypothetical protein
MPKMNETYFAVFSAPDPEQPSVFWGAFATKQSAEEALAEFLESHVYWELEEFSIHEFEFGKLL